MVWTHNDEIQDLFFFWQCNFQWNNVQILDEELSYRKRLISKMLHIKKQKNSFNLQTDTEGLHKAYLPIVNKVWLFDTDDPSPLLVRGDPFQRAVTLVRHGMFGSHICIPFVVMRLYHLFLYRYISFDWFYSCLLVSFHFLS